MDDYGRLWPIISRRKAITIGSPQIARKGAVQLLKIGETKSKELFNQLLSKKLIERIGKGRATFYKLRKKQV
ncbi:hypothetical protein [uncultured Christiangramia sp.]|uniref:hypothetical protein n=1 Tax=uncultured Christiangramia sp. TaxID=503836 RepID=UPI00262D164E|nr:hypothetical protein [uncultured Christiangramia sp.]